MDDSAIIGKIGELIDQGVKLSDGLDSHKNYRFQSYWNAVNKNLIELTKWKEDGMNLLKLRFGGSSYYGSFLKRVHVEHQNSGEFYKENIAEGVGVLKSLKESMENGLTEDLFYQREVILFTDLLEQAYEFLKKDFDPASLIYGRIVLESVIKEFAKSKELDISGLKFDHVIIELRKKGLISKQFEHSLRANYSLGGSQHDLEELKKIQKSEIRSLLDFIRDRVLTL